LDVAIAGFILEAWRQASAITISSVYNPNYAANYELDWVSSSENWFSSVGLTVWTKETRKASGTVSAPAVPYWPM